MPRAARFLLGIPLALFGAWLVLIASGGWWLSHRPRPGDAEDDRVIGGTVTHSDFVMLNLGPWHPSFATDSWGFVVFCSATALVGIAAIGGAGVLALGGGAAGEPRA